MATRSREKSAARKANAEKRPHAIARYIRISSRKVKVVIDLIRGKSVKEAQAILTKADATCQEMKAAAEHKAAAVTEDILAKSRSAAGMQRKKDLLAAKQQVIGEVIDQVLVLSLYLKMLILLLLLLMFHNHIFQYQIFQDLV